MERLCCLNEFFIMNPKILPLWQRTQPFVDAVRVVARSGGLGRSSVFIFLISLTCAHAAPVQTAAVSDLPKNLAPTARVSASSQFNEEYRPAMAITGVFPSEFQRAGREWAVRATQNGWFELNWDEAVEAAQVIYFARTTSPFLECFKEYQVFLNGGETPAIQGKLEHRRGPQRIDFPRQRISKLRIEFLSAYPDSPNPGAAQIAVFPSPVGEAQLAEMLTPPEEMGPEALALRRDLIAGRFGFREMLLVQRKPLDISHVYVYHVEGFRPGGGLYIYRPEDA